MENKQLVVKSFDEIKELGNVMSASGYFDGVSGAQAITKILIGQSLGLSPAVAMSGINVIKGKPELSVHVMAGMIKASGKYNYTILESTDTLCRIEYFENGKSIGISEFNSQDAVSFGLAGKDNFKKYPEEMMYARAMSKGTKRFCPDIYMIPVYAENELSDANSRPIEVNITPPKVQTATHAEIEDQDHIVLEPPKEKPVDGPPVGQIKTAFDIDDLDRFEKWMEKYPENTRLSEKFEYLLECITDPTEDQLKAENKTRVSESVDRINDNWKDLYSIWQKIGNENTYKIRKKFAYRFKVESIDWTGGNKLQVDWMISQFKHYKLNPTQEQDIQEIFETTEEPIEVAK